MTINLRWSLQSKANNNVFFFQQFSNRWKALGCENLVSRGCFRARIACGPDGVEPKGDKCHGYVSGILEVRTLLYEVNLRAENYHFGMILL